MKRTTVMLPSGLKSKAERRAKKMGISLGEVIRESLESWLARQEPADDPFFSSTAVYTGPVPRDSSANHDKYLYGDRS